MEDNKFKYDKVIITEGYSDYLSTLTLLQKLKIRNIKVISLTSATTQLPSKVIDLCKNKDIFIAFDDDEAGLTGTEIIYNDFVENLPNSKTSFSSISKYLLNKNDMNDFLKDKRFKP